MAKEIVGVLTEHQASIVVPEVQRLGELNRAAAEQAAKCRSLVAMVEPRAADPANGIKIDLDTLELYRETAE